MLGRGSRFVIVQARIGEFGFWDYEALCSAASEATLWAAHGLLIVGSRF